MAYGIYIGPSGMRMYSKKHSYSHYEIIGLGDMMILNRKSIRQLKKFIANIDGKIEDLYAYVEEDGKVYAVAFDKEHVHISYLLIGETRDWEPGAKLIQGDYKGLKKFLHNVKINDGLGLSLGYDGLEIIITHNDYNADKPNLYTIHYTIEDIRLGLSYFLQQEAKEFHLSGNDLKCIGLYKTECTKICIGGGRIIFKFYDDKGHRVHAKHIICDEHNNKETDCFHAGNRYLLRILAKFPNDNVITLRFREDLPLVIESEDYIGILAPRLLFDGDLVEDI